MNTNSNTNCRIVVLSYMSYPIVVYVVLYVVLSYCRICHIVVLSYCSKLSQNVSKNCLCFLEREETKRRLARRNTVLVNADLEGDEMLERLRAEEVIRNQKVLRNLAAVDGTKLDVPNYVVHNIDLTLRRKVAERRKKPSFVSNILIKF